MSPVLAAATTPAPAPPPAPAPDLVRITVFAGDRRADLAVPAAVPVAELVPGLALRLVPPDPTGAGGGLHLVTLAGRVLDTGGCLGAQGVADGALLVLTPVLPDLHARLHDDVAEAVADVTQGVPLLSARVTAPSVQQAAGVAALVLGAVGMIPVATTGAALVSGAVALGLVGAAVALSRRSPSTPTWLVALLAASGTAYAAACGTLLVAGAGAGAALPLVGAGSGAVLVGVASLVGLARGRFLALPAVLVGGLAAASGGLARATGVPIPVVATVGLVVAVLGVGSAPGLAVAATGLHVAPVADPHDGAASPLPVDLAGVAADVDRARALLLVVAVTVGLLLVLVGPVAVSLGPSGAIVAAACSLVVMLRTRGQRGGLEVPVALASGALGLAVVAAAALVLQPGWRPVTVLVVVLVGAGTVVASLLPGARSVRWARLADLLENAALAVLPPGVLLVTGGLARIVG